MASPSPLMMRASLLLLLFFATSSSCVAIRSTPQFAGLNRITSKRRTIRHITQFRGGAIDSDEEYDSEEYDSDDEEPIVVKAKKLASSTKTKVQKAKGAAAKAKVSVAMASSSSGGDGLGSLYRQYVPYIIRACLNPFTLMSMTKGYFISLFDINYLKEVSATRVRLAAEVRVTVD